MIPCKYVHNKAGKRSRFNLVCSDYRSGINCSYCGSGLARTSDQQYLPEYHQYDLNLIHLIIMEDPVKLRFLHFYLSVILAYVYREDIFHGLPGLYTPIVLQNIVRFL